jgi:hypothetical protein
MRKKRDLTTWAFLKAPHNELSESFKPVLNKLGENGNVDV